ncbi:ABC transporter substrate-binding protein [Qiania dongpingensis]|uniref:ABC transporter substrate-binding protein n=1 Tax=Qiania dongpingensis TaxID=2763669 RepID=A0A7G9G2J2_9FIRM|nr:ABC transporter substrate-binding protein [Qiania dongpingensis]QNM05024.1 ABC transporter substrate-binding protein [Qiania dongpingensis]
MKKVVSLMLALVMVFSLAACGGKDKDANKGKETTAAAGSEETKKEEGSASGDAETIKIGLCQPFTGPNAVAGEYSRYGVDLAVEEINNAGGFEVGGKMYKIEIVEEDNEGKPEITNNAYNKLIGQDKVAAIIGPDSSGPLISAGPLATAAKVPAIGTTSSNPDCTTVGGEYVFRACWIDSFQAVVCAKMAQETLKASKVAVLYSNADDYSSGLATNFKKEFEAAGGEVVAFEAYAGADVKDFKAQLTNIQNSGAEVIFLPNQAGELPLQIKQIREMGIEAEIMGEMSWDNPNVPELAGNENVEGCYFISLFAADSTDPVSQAFTKAFREKYNKEPNTQSTMSYDCVQILVDSFKRAGKVDDSAALRDAIQATDINLPSGHLVYDENRDPEKSANVMIYKDGVPTYVSTINP